MNSLQNSRSPFLQHGAEQPVNWMPWGDAAFARAKAENKPVLLDIGAVWCHWCHVMDRESYEDAETAVLINENFVAVKVDRDESPDVDARYQRAVQTLTGQGGWPLTAFLTPDGEVYYGGTYFPPTDAHGRPSFKRVLVEIARVWREEPQRALAGVQQIRERLQAYAQSELQSGSISPELVDHTVEEFAEAFDFRFGGFGRAPKFPNPGALSLLLDHHLDTGADWSKRIVVETLDAMAKGGMYDQLGGGFHRYATDARWLVPHFEKMAYDNGPLLEVYAKAFAVTGNGLYREIAEGIVAHYDDVASDLVAAGGFPASQDADHSPNDDGDYWTWTHAEIEQVLGDRAQEAIAYFGLDDAGSSMHLDESRHVLFRSKSSQPDAEITRQLKAARDKRPAPYVDKTFYSGWGALVVSGHIAAARYCAIADASDKALRALERIFSEAYDANKGVMHRVGDNESGEHLEDQAYVIAACLDAFESTQEELWLDRAVELTSVCNTRFLTPEGAYADRPHDAAAPVATMNEAHFPITDAPTPSGNGVMALNLMRLSVLLEDDEYRSQAATLVTGFGGSAPKFATAVSTYIRAVAWLTHPVTTVTVNGDTLVDAALRHYRPRTVVMRQGEEHAVVCAGTVCATPVHTPDELHELLNNFRG